MRPWTQFPTMTPLLPCVSITPLYALICQKKIPIFFLLSFCLHSAVHDVDPLHVNIHTCTISFCFFFLSRTADAVLSSPPTVQIIRESEKGAEALHSRLKDFCYTIGPRLSGTPQLDTAIHWVRFTPITPISCPGRKEGSQCSFFLFTPPLHPLLSPLPVRR